MHNLQEVKSRRDIVLVVGEGDLCRFADGFVCLSAMKIQLRTKPIIQRHVLRYG